MTAPGARTTFSTSRLLEFASRKELVAQTGTAPADWPLMVIRELVDNGLDACEEAGIAPAIRVIVAGDRIRVTDNGPGLPPATVASVLDFTTRTSSREAYCAPDRGRQGNALKTLVAVPLALSGTESRVEIRACGVHHSIRFRVDRIVQAPEVEHVQTPCSVRIGTSVTVWWPESSCQELAAAKPRFLPLLARYADLNPHLAITGTWIGGGDRAQRGWPATDATWMKWTPAAPTSPHWYGRDELERLAGAFLAHDRRNGGARLLRHFIGQFDGLSGTAKRKRILDALGLQRATLDQLLVNGDFNHPLVDLLLEEMQREARPVRHDRLGALGRDNLAHVVSCYGTDPQTFRYKQIKGVEDGVPFIAEAAFASAPSAGQGLIFIAGVNWAPSLRGNVDPFNLGPTLAANYCTGEEPVFVLAHLICPRPEFYDRGKSQLSHASPGFDEVRQAVGAVIADWAKQRLAELRDASQRKKREEKLRAEKPRTTALKDLVLKYLPQAIANTSNNGKISFSQRDVFYVIRVPIKVETTKPLEYNYFTQLLTDYEFEHGEIPGMQREPRGTIYHPHLREKIPLGTASVAAYERPFWTFNKLVVVEKTGTQDNLIEVGWPEEYDCAVASVVGFTTRAIKDLLDMLATSPEPIMVFCVHDADASGTLIFETLIRETKARAARKIEVVDLGLNPWEAIDLELAVEPVEPTRKERRRAVAKYVDHHDAKWMDWLEARGFNSWAAWLQKFRVELNAMTPVERIDWLTKKIENYERKVIPPAKVLHGKRSIAARLAIYEELERRAKLHERTDEIMEGLVWAAPQERLAAVTERYLNRPRFRKKLWTSPMKRAGRKLAARVMRSIPEGQS
jgi:hypothetical protein